MEPWPSYEVVGENLGRSALGGAAEPTCQRGVHYAYDEFLIAAEADVVAELC
jgi:hypothetical protein